MVLNNDIRLDPKCIEELKRCIEKDAKYGSCASKILPEYEDNIIYEAGIVVCPEGLSIGRRRFESADQYGEEVEFFWQRLCLTLPHGDISRCCAI